MTRTLCFIATVTVFAAQVSDQDGNDPPDNMTANNVFSFTIDQAPSVTATVPANGATTVALNANLSITFSEPVNVTGNWFQIVCPTTGTRNVADTVVTGGPTTFTINPNADFTFNETCTVTVFAAQVSDQDSADPPDNMLANFVFSYTTVDAAPTVTATTPTNAATQQATNTDISVTFSEPVNVTGNWFQIVCTTSGTRNVADTVVTGGPSIFTINPNTDFTNGETCTVTIFAAQVTDQDTNDPPDNMAANFVFAFTMDTPPAVTTTIPTNGATQVATNTNITINFNENVNILDSTAFTVECPVATPIAFNVTPVAPGGTNSFVLDPTSDLPVGTICTVTVVASKVTDVDAGDPPDNMTANFVFTFTTDQAPSVTATVPTNNATDVALNSTVSITFSELVNVATGGVTINCGSTVNFTPALPQNNLTTLVLTPTGGLPAGSNCTVTVDKTKISDVDTSDPPDNMVNDFVFSFKVKPDAINDTYPGTLIGNVGVNSANVPYSITTNDVSANTFSITAVQAVNTVVAGTITAASANGGTVVMSVTGGTIGRFTYNPPPGFEGTDTFSYTISRDDGGGTDSATVSIPISGMIWFINNNAVSCTTLAAGCGRLSNPFSSLAAFQALNNGTGNNPAANDNIFVYESAADYVGPVTLLNGQKFIGQDATATLATITGLTPPAGSDPLPAMNSGNGVITNITSAGIGITVGQNNTLRGFTGGNATTDISGNAFGTLNISDVTLNGNGQTLNLTNGTLNGTFGSLSSTNSATTGLSLTTVAGSLTVPTTTITNPTGIGISVNTSSAALSFGNVSATSSGGTGVSLTTNTGAITFADLDISPDANQRGLLATDNTQTLTTTSGTIATSGAAGVEISRSSSTTPLAIVLTSVSTTGGPNGIFLKNTSGSFSVIGDGSNTSVGGNATGGTISGMTGADGATSGTGVYAENVQNLTLRRITINGTNQNFGIRGNSVNNFTLEYATVNGTNGTAAALAPPEGAGEGAVYFGNTTTTGMTGTGVITNCIISGGRSRNFSLINSSGSLNRLTVTGTTFGLVQNFVDAQRVFSVEGRPSAGGTILNTTVTGSSFAGSPGDVVNFTGQEPSTATSVLMDVVFQNNTVTNTHAFNNIGGFGIKLADFSGMTFNVSNNSFSGANGSTVVLQMGAPVGGSTIATNLSGTINNNQIGVNGVADSGSKTGNGIFLSLADNTTAPKGQATFAITNNTIRNWHGNFGISADNTGGNYDVNLTVTGNVVQQPSATSFSGLGLAAGAPSSTNDIDVCAAITGNDFSASSPAGVNIDVLIGVSGSVSSIRLPGYSGTTLAQVQNFVQNNQLNPGTTSVSAFDDNGNGSTAPSFIGGAACTSPTTMVLPFKSTERDHFALNREAPRTTPQVNRTAHRTLSHHAQITKRAAIETPAPELARNTVVNSTVTTPVVNKIVSRSTVNANHAQQDKTKRGAIVVKPGVRADAGGGETVTHSVGTLLAGKTVHIQFQVTVNNPYSGGPTVTNQGTVSGSNFSDVLTDDPAVGGANDPTQTPVLQIPNLSISDAQANEPPSGSAPMVFTVSLSAPAPASGASVHYQTADDSPVSAVAGVDYTAIPDTVLNFAAGEQFKTITVNILADAGPPESDETFLVKLSNPTNLNINDNQAVGTIKQGNAAGTFLISELRTSGPAGAGDDFVEVYNNSDVPLTIAASDASAGYGLFKMGADCSAPPVLIGTIPNGTVIPARGHYLFIGSSYSLADYGGTGAAAGNLTLTSDIESDGNVAIFTTTTVANLSSVTRLDAVGFGTNTGGTCDLLREGTTLTPLSGSTLQYSYVRDECGKKGNPAMFGLCPTGGAVADTNVNGDDFIFVDTTAANTVAGQRLGAPGPQNLASPLNRNSAILALLLDNNIGAPSPPNRVRDLTPVTNGANGTLSVRRRFVNNTGAAVTRLRFRIVDISTISVPGGIADLRALTSTNVVVNGITDNGTCTAAGQSTPCSITVTGTTLETPPAQAIGGGHNSTFTVNLGTPLAAGASIDLQFLLGVQQTGSFKFFFNIEALP